MRDRALIAEDNDDMRDLLQEVLEDAGYETLVAANGRQALAHIEKENEVIDLMITDVRMPEMTGHGLLAKARELRSEAPVIVITAFGSVEAATNRARPSCSASTARRSTADSMNIAPKACPSNKDFVRMGIALDVPAPMLAAWLIPKFWPLTAP